MAPGAATPAPVAGTGAPRRRWPERAASRLENAWYARDPLAWPLWPFSCLWAGAARLRRLAYRARLLPVHRVPVPVIVVGNIAVGGTGKTPLVIAVTAMLAAHGRRPGVACNGYRGTATSWPQQVRADSDPVVVGDEAVMIARRTGCPVAAGPDRYAVARALVEHGGCDVVVCDDGLQHYRLARDIEVLVIDGVRRHGNGRCLPGGPLREPAARARSVDLVVANAGAQRGEFEMRLAPAVAVSVRDPKLRRPLSDFDHAAVHAVAGIGNPDRFFRMLAGRGMAVSPHPFPDHHPYTEAEIRFDDGAPVLMTEKDAVKCVRFADERHWYVPVAAELGRAFEQRLLELLSRHDAAPGTAR